MKPLFSVIIPCFNDGKYLPDALASLKNCDAELFETIIVNDGSKDEHTLKFLSSLEAEGYQIIHQENKGLSGARNTGIKSAQGKYIVPLDSDNKIRNEYLIAAKKIFETENDISVVYGRPQHFGANNEIPLVGEFNLQRLMLGNYIDACGIYKKEAWQSVGGYDEQMRLGLEDWEFWLRLAFRGHKFKFVNEVLFDYRVRPDSMVRTDTTNRYNSIIDYVEKKHPAFMSFDAIRGYFRLKYRDNFTAYIIKSLFYFTSPKVFDYLLKKDFIRKL